MDEEIKRQLQAISELTNSAGWGYLRHYFNIQIQAIQDEINQVGRNEMIYSYPDIKKLEMRNLKDLINFPDQYIAMIQNPPEEEEDPYNNKI
jgi:hypothetical protein